MNRYVHEVGKRLEKCILTADKQAWSQLVMVEDDIAQQSMNKWFDDYFLIHRAKQCEVIFDDTDDNWSDFEFKCMIKVEYQENKAYSTNLIVNIREEDDKTLKIVCIEKFHLSSPRRNLCWHVTLVNDKPWWKNSILKEEVNKNDDLPYNLLARAITRNVRFREAHIQLECVSILTCMMSNVISNIYYQLELSHENSEQKLKLIYDVLMDKFRLRLTRPDRDNTWASKYLVPWYGIEETIVGKDEGKRIAVSCNFFMTTLYSLLRWCGFRVSQLVQFRIVNQDYLIVCTDERELFFISHDNLTRCSKRMIYPSGCVSRVFGAEWFIDFKRNTAEISSELIQEYNNIAKNSFLPMYNSTGKENEMITLASDFSTGHFRNSVFGINNKTNSSIYPWIKYANQTLFVSKPETYIYWSIQSNWGNVFFKCEEEVYEYINRMRSISIFPEEDRIMTSDQCIRHQTGGKKDIAVFLFAAFKKFLNGQGCVVFTKKYEYVVYRFNSNNEWIIYNTCIHKKTKNIEGEIFLAFNDTNSCYLTVNINLKNQAWFKKIAKEIVEQNVS